MYRVAYIRADGAIFRADGIMAAEVGRKGGLAKTEAKSSAARENGAKGGRPREIEGTIFGRNLVVRDACPYCGKMVDYSGDGADYRGQLIQHFTCSECGAESRIRYE